MLCPSTNAGEPSPPPLRLVTPRLELVATTLAHVKAELEAPEQLGPLLGATVCSEWPAGEYDRNAMQFFADRLAAEGPASVGWYGWYCLERDASAPPLLVGSAGFIGRPNEEGSVEIGYSIIPRARRRGYATEAVRALVAWAQNDPRVRTIIAHTGRENTASIAVLERSGFTFSGIYEADQAMLFRLSAR